MTAGLTLKNVTRAYHGRRAVNAVSLAAPAAGVLALLGASGSGKSTLLRLIAGLEPLDDGEIRLHDRVISTAGGFEPPEQRRIGLVFQDYALFPHLTAVANVAFGLDRKDKAASLGAARDWLDRVGLAHRAEAYPHELSGGEQQRVALARALAPRPAAILLDEPFSGLDPHLRADLRDRALAAIREANATAVFVTHDAEEALYLADHLAILAEGRLEQAASPREVYARPASLTAASALGPVNTCQGVVRGSRIQTPFGDVPAFGLRDGEPALAAVRAEALRINPGEGARIVDRRPQGARDMVRLAAGDLIWRGEIAPESTLEPGATCAVTLAGAGVFAFSQADAQ